MRRFRWFQCPAILAILFAVTCPVPEIKAEETTFPIAASGPKPDRLIMLDEQKCYGISAYAGFLVSGDGGSTWSARNKGLPVKSIYPFAGDIPRPLTALAVDPANPVRVAVTTASGLYLSADAGMTWRLAVTSDRFARNTYFTTVALAPGDEARMAVGTSFDGIFETKDNGRTWTGLTKEIKALSRGAGYTEEITALSYQLDNPAVILLACGLGRDLFALDTTKRSLSAIAPAAMNGQEMVDILQYRAIMETEAGRAFALQIGTDKRLLVYSNGLDRAPSVLRQFSPTALPPDRSARIARAGNRYAIYLTPAHARGKRLDTHLAFMKKNGFNALVVDFKDDFGYVTYDSQVPLARRINAVRRLIDLAELRRKTAEYGVYLIARLVVFKDQRLYNYNNYAFAAWDRVSNAPWRYLIKTTDPETQKEIQVQQEYWVDPFARETWEYNIAVAQELQAAGIDEIQFDYIRFPTDGPISRLRYRFMREGQEKPDALESFLAMAREKLHVPISTDLFGFACWYRVQTWTGQDLSVIGRYVDVISPMFYPSHFPADFAKGGAYTDRARRIYYEGTARAARIAGHGTLIRPYVQAFLLGGELKMSPETYGLYLQRQIEGAVAAGASGFALWNNSNRYYMVRKPLAAYLPSPAAAATK